MLSKKILWVFLVLVALGLFLWWARRGSSVPAYTTQTASLGPVEVEVTPQKLGVNEKENIFEVKFNTHSVDLDFDFAKIMVLTDNLGNQYQAVRWEGGRGGHHLEGKIVFPKLKTGVKKVSLKIFAIGGVERNFNWDLTTKVKRD